LNAGINPGAQTVIRRPQKGRRAGGRRQAAKQSYIIYIQQPTDILTPTDTPTIQHRAHRAYHAKTNTTMANTSRVGCSHT